MSNFAEISWLSEFCSRPDAIGEAFDRLRSHPARLWLVQELMELQPDAALVDEVLQIDARVRGEHQLDEEADVFERAVSHETISPMLTAHLSPFLDKRRELLEQMIGHVRENPISPPRERSTEPMEFARNGRVLKLEYWQWGQPGTVDSVALFYSNEEWPVSAGGASALDACDRIDGEEVGPGSLHAVHSSIVRHWPHLVRVPLWFLRVRYEAIGWPAEVWLRFTDGHPAPVACILDLIASA